MAKLNRYTYDPSKGYILPVIRQVEDEYLKSGRWKCPNSPTGAHFNKEISKEGGYGLFLCIHCMRVVRLPVVYDAALRIFERR